MLPHSQLKAGEDMPLHPRPPQKVIASFQPLELSYQIDLELRAYPHGELKGNVLVGVCAAITSSLRDNTDSISFVSPLFGSETETVQPCLRFNYVEFGTIKIRIHLPLPYSKELYGIAVAQPVREEKLTKFLIVF